MSYLFDTAIEAGLKVDLTKNNSTYLKQQAEKATADLIRSSGRDFNNHDDHEASATLVTSMGQKTRAKDGSPHAQDHAYVGDAWRMVSDNCGIVRQMVHDETYHAYQIGLDTRNPVVIGAMFKLAVMVWSMLGDYSSPTQSQGRR